VAALRYVAARVLPTVAVADAVGNPTSCAAS
jgi:hypothetical protein